MSRQKPEEEAQRAVVNFLRNLRNMRMPIQFYHPPNELLRTQSLRKIYWGLGVEKGAPDLIVFVNGVTVFVELKIKGNKTTDAQDAWLETVSAQGFETHVITVEYPHEAVHAVAKIISDHGVKC